MSTRDWIRLGLEVLWDLVTGKLERKAEPAVTGRALPHVDSARQSKAARCAGHEMEPQCRGRE